MLSFEFDGALFQLDAREPEFAALSQLPPRIAAQYFPLQPPPFMPLIHPPSIAPTSARWTCATWCCFGVIILRLDEAMKRSQYRSSARFASAEYKREACLDFPAVMNKST